MDRYFVVANCDRMAPGQTLGVAHFAFSLLEGLRRSGRVRVLCKVTPDLETAYRAPGRMDRVRDGVVATEYGGAVDLASAPVRPEGDEVVVEYSPHHFQTRVTDAPSVVTCHDLHVFDIPWKYKRQRQVADLFRANMRTASVILTHFPRTAAALPERVPECRGRILLTESPPMIDATRPDDGVMVATARRFAVDGRRPMLLYPAQLQQHKNHRNLLAGLASARARGLDARLICPGSEFKAYHTGLLRSFAEELGIADAVDLPGFVSDEELRALYALCDGVICPSLAEGGAYVALEGVMFRRPVACSSIDSARMHLESVGAGAHLFDPYDPGEISDAIERLVEDGARLIGRNEASLRLLRSWTFDDVAIRYLGAMRDAATGASSREPTAV